MGRVFESFISPAGSHTSVQFSYVSVSFISFQFKFCNIHFVLGAQQSRQFSSVQFSFRNVHFIAVQFLQHSFRPRVTTAQFSSVQFSFRNVHFISVQFFSAMAPLAPFGAIGAIGSLWCHWRHSVPLGWHHWTVDSQLQKQAWHQWLLAPLAWRLRRHWTPYGRPGAIGSHTTLPRSHGSIVWRE